MSQDFIKVFCVFQAGYPPVIIRKQDRMMYYDCLQLANQGDTRPFIRFIAHCTEKTLDVYLWATKEMLPKIGQNFDSPQNKNSWDSTFQRDSGSEGVRKDTTADEIYINDALDNEKEFDSSAPQWKLDDHFLDKVSEHDHDADQNEDDLLSEDINNNDYNFKEPLWFEAEEDGDRVYRTGRYSKIVDEEDLFENSDILNGRGSG